MKPELLINTITAWDEPPRARHQFTFAIAKKIPVAFITNNKIGWMKIVISRVEENITLIEPHFPIDFRFRYRLPLINEIYQLWLYSRLKKIYGQIVVVNFDFTGSLLSNYFQETIYYCNDEYTSTSKYNSRIINNYISKCEQKVAGNAKFCIATSAYLSDKLRNYNPATSEIPLGVDASFFQTQTIRNENRSNGQINVGLLGYISERQISLNIVNDIILQENMKLIIIGPIENSFLKKMNHPEKVILTGMLTGQSLMKELEKIDVGIALYNLKSTNRGATANKLWQYISLGKPAVVSNLPNLQRTAFPEKSVYTIMDDTEAVGMINRAYREDTGDLRKRRINFAKENTWDVRIDKFLDIYNFHFPGQFMEK